MKSRFIKLIVMLLLFVCLGSGLFAGGKQEVGKAKGPVTVTFWNGFTAADGDALREIVKEWTYRFDRETAGVHSAAFDLNFFKIHRN